MRPFLRVLALTLTAASLAAAIPPAPLVPAEASAERAAVTTAVTTVGRAPAPVRIVSLRLATRPPRLVRPVTIRLRNNQGDIKLSPKRDYRLVFPRGGTFVNGKGLSIAGGHNVVVIGGLVDVRNGYLHDGRMTRRAAYIRKSTGIVFVEGIRFLSSTRHSLTEGFDLSCPGASIVLQNIVLGSTLTGSASTNHADAIQAWAGPRRLLVDGFVATTRYQGFFLLPKQHGSAAVGGWDLRRVFLRGVNSGYLLWRDNGTFPIRASQVYVVGSPKQHAGMWPNRSLWRHVIVGVPHRPFAAHAGARYRSPGYR